jgi:hypothetical protein
MSGFFGMMFSAAGGGSGPPPVTPSEYIAFSGSNTSNNLKVYNWNVGSGVGTSFVSPTISDLIRSTSFVPDNSNISVSTANSPWIYVWKWSALGFGTKYSNPETLLTPSSNGFAGYSWTANIDALLTANFDARTTGSFPQAWQWSSAGFGTKYSNGAGFLGAQGITINGDSSLVAFNGLPGPPYVHLYPWASATGFGTKYSTPTFSPQPLASGIQKISFNKVTNDLAIASVENNVWACRVTSAGFGTVYSSPSTPITTRTNSLLFSPNGAVIGMVNDGFPSINAYQWGAGFGTKYANSENLTFLLQQSMDWSSTTNAIAGTSSSTSPFVNIYDWSSAGFGNKYTIPTGIPPNASRVSFSNKSR